MAKRQQTAAATSPILITGDTRGSDLALAARATLEVIEDDECCQEVALLTERRCKKGGG